MSLGGTAITTPEPVAAPAAHRVRNALVWLRHRSPDAAFAAPWWLAWISVGVVLATYVSIAWTSDGPLFAADEVGIVGASKVLAHGSAQWTLTGSGYMPGLSLLLVPAWWFTDDSFQVYQVGLAIGVAISVLTVWPLSLIARGMGIASRPGSVIIGSVVMLFPARTLAANYVVSEALVTLLTATTFAMALAYSRQVTARYGALLGVAAGASFLAHGRAIALVLAVGLWVIVVTGRKWRPLLAFSATGGAVATGSWLLFSWIADRLYWQDDRFGITFNGASSMNGVDMVAAAGGMAWYALAAWPAIGILGLIVVAKRGARRRGPEPLMLIALLTAVGLALVQLDLDAERGFPRLDIWIYGRYIDHLLTVLAVIGLATLVRVRHRASIPLVLASSMLVGLVFMLVTVPRIPVGGYWTDVHVAGVSHLLSEANFLESAAEPWLMITVATIVIGVLFAALGRLRFAVPVLAVFGLALSLATDTTRVDPRDANSRVSPAINEPLGYIGDDARVAFNVDYGVRINFFAFSASGLPIVPVTLEEAAADYDAVYTGYEDASPAAFGAKVLAAPRYYYGAVLWVFPGPLFDELAAKDLLIENDD